jgi:5-formyltetrahydrofolate cyclo-ligase
MRVALPLSPFAAARKALRAELRAKRRAVTPVRRTVAAERVARNLDRAFHLRPGLRVALYASFPEELDSAPLIELARSRRCRIFLPRINRRNGRIRFLEAAAGGRESVNHLGIVEPVGTQPIAARWLDLVVQPLVGFDEYGLRLGMGGGFYDRTFAFRNIHHTWRGPRLVGVAYSFQQVPSIAAAAYDVRMDAVVTEKGVVRCRTGS